MFYALAIICDDFFVPSLEKICERLHLSEDVAGATFMAAGSSAPELFTSVIGVFITKGDVGVGTIVGSAVFNILCIIGVCGLFAGQIVALSSWSLLRDSVYYTCSVAALILFIYDEKVAWWESLILVLMYFIYILIMNILIVPKIILSSLCRFNANLQHMFERRTKNVTNMVNGLANNTEMDDNSNCDATVVLLKKGNFHRKASVIMVDELLSAYPHQLSFSEAGLRIMITSHFPPRTRLSMASRMLINERQRLINSRVYTNGESEIAIKVPFKHTMENGSGLSNSAKGSTNGTRRDEEAAEGGNETENENDDNENNENDEEEEEDDDDDHGPYTPFDPPCKKFLCFYLLYLFLTFQILVFYHSLKLKYLIWSIPLIIYKKCGIRSARMGDMAVSNSIGSNVFDILVGLGLPWSLQTLAVNYGSVVSFTFA
ncbi:hypothetical protein E2320_010923 [Naja naja]|nr:hypothetical protein E2320_010923 [Naja naja]